MTILTREISVETHDLTRKFGKFTAVDRFSITVYKGEIFGFLGANGAGKTTVIRMLCGLLKPSSGTAMVAGFDVFSESEEIKKHIGYMSQKFSLYGDLSVQENIDFYGGIYGLSRNEISEKSDLLVKELMLQPYIKYYTRDLPLGIKQRLALGCAMLHDPPILFLDEPTSGVDPKARREFWNLLYSTVSKGKTIFVTTHYLDEAEYCHRVSIMQDGRVIALDSPSGLKVKYNKTSIHDIFMTLSNPLENLK